MLERKEVQDKFIRRVDVQTETIERYVREGKPVPVSEHRTFKYFKEETLEKYAQLTLHISLLSTYIPLGFLPPHSVLCWLPRTATQENPFR